MLPNTICLLTGATGGIGREIAKQLDKIGVELILSARNEAMLKTLEDSLVGNHRVICADLNLIEDRTKLIRESFSIQGKYPNLLINNAGISLFQTFDEVSSSDIEKYITTNLVSAIDLTHRFLAQTNQASTIVNIGSAFGSIGYPGYTIYCASKFGLKGFTEALAREMSASDHRICYFAPRATDTSMNSDEANQMNKSLGNHCDSPELVAKELITMIQKGRSRHSVGWPEKLLARLNGLFPELVDKALSKQTKAILNFAHGEN